MDRSNFSLIELLLVIGIIAILVAIVIIAINPIRQLGSARDAERQEHLDHILTAIYQYAVDHDGDFPPGLSKEDQEICVYGIPCGGIDLTILREKYLPKIARDPLSSREGGGTNYFISVGDDRRVTVVAPGAEEHPPLRMVR